MSILVLLRFGQVQVQGLPMESVLEPNSGPLLRPEAVLPVRCPNLKALPLAQFLPKMDLKVQQLFLVQKKYH